MQHVYSIAIAIAIARSTSYRYTAYSYTIDHAVSNEGSDTFKIAYEISNHRDF